MTPRVPRRLPVTRRRVLAGFSLLGAGALPAFAEGAAARVVSLDYALAETLIAIGAPLAALSGADDWSTWVVEPPLPPGVRNLGNAQLPNFELIARLRPDLILTTPFLDAVEAPLRRVGPLLRVPIYEEGRRPFDGAVAATLLLGERLGRSGEAKAFLAAADREFGALAERIGALERRPLLLTNMMDGRHIRVHGGDGLLQGVLDRLGVENAYKGHTNYWGFETLGVERLASMGEAHLISFEPVPPDAAAVLNRSPLWLELPFVRAGRVSTLPAVNAFGAVPSALRFARLVAETLEAAG